jgi:hypothetical protein
MSYSQELSRIFDGDNLPEKNHAISVVFSLLGKLASEIKLEQDQLGKPRALKKMADKAKKLPDNEEEVQRLTDLYQEAKSNKSALGDKRQLLTNLQKEQKKLSLTIKRG